MKKNLLVSILVYVALAIAAATVIPFSANSVAGVEGIIKFVIFPFCVLDLSLAILVIRAKFKEVDELGAYAAVLPVTAYMTGGFLYVVTLALRNPQLLTEFALSNPKLAVLICGIVATLLLACVTVLLPKFKLQNTEAKAPWNVVALYALLACYAMFGTILVQGQALKDFSKGGTTVLIIFIVLAVILAGGFACQFFLASKKLDKEGAGKAADGAEAKEPSSDEENYEAMDDEYLLNMYDYSKAELIKRGHEFPEAQAEPQIVEKIVEVEKVVEVEKKPEPRPRPQREKKVIEPAVAVLAKFATDNFEDVTVVYGKDEENFKIMRGKKLMMQVQTTNNDYRVIFQRKPISVSKMMLKYPGAILQATSPKGEQWFKITNKGQVSEEDLLTIVKFSHKFMEDAEAKALAKKEREKEKAKAKRLAQKQKEKEKIAAQKAKEKAKEEAAKQKALEKEQAKQAALEAKQKAKEEAAAQKAKEKEEAKAAAKAQREAEKAAKKEAEALAKEEANEAPEAPVEEAPVEEAPQEAPAEEAQAEEPAAEEAPAAEEPAEKPE